MFELTMFIRDRGADVTRLAQLNAETFSGNSDRNGATHWTNTNVEMPSPAASALRLPRNGGAATYRRTPPTRNSPAISEFRTGRLWASIMRGTLAASSSFSSDWGGIFFMKYK